MSFNDYIRQTPEMKKAIELKKEKAKIIQDKIDAAIANIDTDAPSHITNLRTGEERYEIIKTYSTGKPHVARIKYKVNGKYYVTTSEIIKDYGLNNRQTVINRLRSNTKKWKDWIEL